MQTLKFSFFWLLLMISLTVAASDQPQLAIPGKVVYDSKLDTPPGEPWKILKGDWTLTNGVWRAAEKTEDQHPGVARLPDKLEDFVIEYEFKFEGGRFNSLSINAPKGHLARITITPKLVTIQKDDSDHDGPDKAIVFARLPADFKPGTWHKVRMAMIGDTILGQVDNLAGWGTNAMFKQARTAGLTVGGQAVDFRNFKISAATLNPAWNRIQAEIPGQNGQKHQP